MIGSAECKLGMFFVGNARFTHSKVVNKTQTLVLILCVDPASDGLK